LGTQAEAGDEQSWITAVGSGVRYLGLGNQAEAGDKQSWITGYWQLN